MCRLQHHRWLGVAERRASLPDHHKRRCDLLAAVGTSHLYNNPDDRSLLSLLFYFICGFSVGQF